MALLDRLRRTISERSLFGAHDFLLVAVSGGPDSTALVHALHRLSYRIHVAHLNHGFRGAEAGEDAQFVAQVCSTLGLGLTSVFRDVPAVKRADKVSAQQAARQVRYAFLTETAETVGATWIATGHTQDDRVETMLLNVMRGAGTDGLRGIPYRRDRFVRPMLDVTRDDVESYCQEHDLDPRRDSSNLNPAYARNNVRQELLPYLERRYNESIRTALLRLSEIAAAESDYLSEVARRWLAEHPVIPIVEFSREPLALQRRILREWIRAGRIEQLTDIGHDTIERLRHMMERPFALTLPGGEWLVCGDGITLQMRHIPERGAPVALEISLPPFKDVAFLDWELHVNYVPEGIDPNTLKVRTWLAGDRIKTHAGTRKLQDVFVDAKVPRDERVRWPVIVDAAGIAAVPGLTIAERARGLDIRAVKAT